MIAKTETNIQQKHHYLLRLFVAGEGVNSRLARENLKRLQSKYQDHTFEIEIIDLNARPEMALEHGVYISPALQILEPRPGRIVYGNLNEERILEQALNL